MATKEQMRVEGKVCKEMSSRAKSFGKTLVLRSKIWMVKDVLAAEFQLVVNCCQTPVMLGAVKDKTVAPLNKMSSCAWPPLARIAHLALIQIR